MKTKCPFCGQHYDVEADYNGETVDCQNCGKDFIITPLKTPLTPVAAPVAVSASAPVPVRTQSPVSANVTIVGDTRKKGALIGAVVCLILAIIFQLISSLLFLLYSPLYLATFILSIIAISQRRVASGVIVLLLSLIAPTVILIINLFVFAGVASKVIEKTQTATAQSRAQNQQSSNQNAQSNATSSGKTTSNTTNPAATAAPFSGLCGVALNQNWTPRQHANNSQTTGGETMYAFTPSQRFMNFAEYYLLVTPKSNKVYTIWLLKEFKSVGLANTEYEQVKAVIENHYNKKFNESPFGIDKTANMDFDDATLSLRVSNNITNATLSLMATSHSGRAQADKEQRQLTIGSTNTSALQ